MEDEAEDISDTSAIHLSDIFEEGHCFGISRGVDASFHPLSMQITS